MYALSLDCDCIHQIHIYNKICCAMVFLFGAELCCVLMLILFFLSLFYIFSHCRALNSFVLMFSHFGLCVRALCVGYGCFWLVYISYVFFLILILLLLFLFVISSNGIRSKFSDVCMNENVLRITWLLLQKIIKGCCCCCCCCCMEEEVLLIVVSIGRDKLLMEAHREANAWVVARCFALRWN